MKLPRFIIILFAGLLAGSLIQGNFFLDETFTQFYTYLIIGGLIISVSGILLLFRTRSIGSIKTLPVVIAVLWCIYILLNSNFLGGVEDRKIYLLVTFLLFISSALLFSTPSFKWKSFFTTISIIASIEAFICLAQYFNLFKSSNSLFAVTGTSVNPNVTAMFLAMAVPAILATFVSSARRWKFSSICILLGVIAALLILKCRTALIGAALISIIFLQCEYGLIQHFKNRFQLRQRLAIFVILICTTYILGWGLYQSKKDSADGRLLIWKISAAMITQKPFTGYGYGTFEKNYNLFQAEYFKNGKGSTQEIATAGFVSMAYNEFLENTVEGGIFGLLLFVTLLISLLLSVPTKINSLKTNKKTTTDSNQQLMYFSAYAGIAGFAAMSIFNFTIQAIPVTCLFVLYAAVIVAQSKQDASFLKSLSRITSTFRVKYVAGLSLLLAGFYLFSTQINIAKAHLENKDAVQAAKNGDFPEAFEKLRSLKGRLQYSESYLVNFGSILLINKKYRPALEIYTAAKSITSKPELFIRTGDCYRALGQFENAKAEYITAKNIAPNRMIGNYSLMNLYMQMHDTTQAAAMANELINSEPKVKSKQAQYFKKQAQLVKKILFVSNALTLDKKHLNITGKL